ncbi:biotin transporter BioY [Aureibacillus halotolerans]|uniref:Biotin transporter n=1 Tax=Aureibacillus halotolerans TaxID=1508390 RepID=A0A4R6U6D1_9BACI|nr:biotin transporter BioY [Aureibacillus halotolerans]TDQ40423.1 biotin transport system substrate-specific component [Aureibacillus halotolerans]
MQQANRPTYTLTLIALFAALMAIGSNITSWFPFFKVGEVPITLQTFIAILSGALLGKKKGSAAILLYLAIGFCGLPVFSQFRSGPSIVVDPTFGFLLSFPIAAWVTGYWCEKHAPKMKHYVTGALLGCAINYFVGTNLMYLSLITIAEAPPQFSYWMAWLWMLPPLPKDIILSIVAASIALRVYKAIPHLLPKSTSIGNSP